VQETQYPRSTKAGAQRERRKAEVSKDIFKGAEQALSAFIRATYAVVIIYN
jgi:hypothetical protein